MYNSISRANDDLAKGECARMLIDRKYTYPDQPIKWEYTACSRTATATYFACEEPYKTQSQLRLKHHFLNLVEYQTKCNKLTSLPNTFKSYMHYYLKQMYMLVLQVLISFQRKGKTFHGVK